MQSSISFTAQISSVSQTFIIYLLLEVFLRIEGNSVGIERRSRCVICRFQRLLQKFSSYLQKYLMNLMHVRGPRKTEYLSWLLRLSEFWRRSLFCSVPLKAFLPGARRWSPTVFPSVSPWELPEVPGLLSGEH